MSRYEKAAVDPPKALYVDRDCYGPATVQKYFENWPDIKRGRHNEYAVVFKFANDFKSPIGKAGY